MNIGEKKEYADYTIREVDCRRTYSIEDNEDAARAVLAEAQRRYPDKNWMIVRHAHVIDRLV